jgi:hypothetical protein
MFVGSLPRRALLSNVADWSIERTLRTGDAGTGTTVLEELYRETANAPVAVDIDRWWDKLGVHPAAGGNVALDDRAPSAAIRLAITTASTRVLR